MVRRVFRKLSPYQQTTFVASVILCTLCIAWEWFLVPLRPHGSLMVLKCLPLVIFLPGLFRGSNYHMQAVSMVILLYFFEGFARLLDPGLNLILAIIEILLSCVIFFSILKYLAPLKKEAVARKKIQEELEASSEAKHISVRQKE